MLVLSKLLAVREVEFGIDFVEPVIDSDADFVVTAPFIELFVVWLAPFKLVEELLAVKSEAADPLLSCVLVPEPADPLRGCELVPEPADPLRGCELVPEPAAPLSS